MRVYRGQHYRERVGDASANYLRDLGPLLLETVRSAKAAADQSDDAFQRGRAMGLYEAVSLLAQQADAFRIGRDEVGLSGVDLERDLL